MSNIVLATGALQTYKLVLILSNWWTNQGQFFCKPLKLLKNTKKYIPCLIGLIFSLDKGGVAGEGVAGRVTVVSGWVAGG